jgi:molybdenum cofactor cytidylyltransferase
MTFGLIPAAGLSRRMGRPKLALPVAGRTVLEHVLAALRQAGVGPTVVVLAPHVADLAARAEAGGALVLRLPAETPDMRATVQRGLDWLEEQFRPAPEDDWLLLPADHPTLDAAVVVRLCQARRDHPQASVVVPTWQGRRGHPALIAWRHVGGIRAHPAGEGLNTYLRRHSQETLEVEASEDVLADLDTPEDYERLLRRRGEAGAERF